MLRYPLTLLTKEVPRLNLRPTSSWLLLQDVHAPFMCLPGGALAEESAKKVLDSEFEEYFGTVKKLGPNISQLVSAARDHGLGVIYSCLGYEEKSTPSRFQRALGWNWSLEDRAKLFENAWQPVDGDPVFAKPGWGALGNPLFEEFLSAHKIENLIVAGAMFDYGIRQTCYELSDRGIGSLIITDAVVATTLQSHTITASNLAHGMVKLRSLAELLDLFYVMDQKSSVLV